MLQKRSCAIFSKTLCLRVKGMKNLEHLDGNWMGGRQLMEGACSEGTLVGMEIGPHCPEQLLLQGGLGDGELLKLLWGH